MVNQEVNHVTIVCNCLQNENLKIANILGQRREFENTRKKNVKSVFYVLLDSTNIIQMHLNWQAMEIIISVIL